jgi:hypothetical protein
MRWAAAAVAIAVMTGSGASLASEAPAAKPRAVASRRAEGLVLAGALSYSLSHFGLVVVATGAALFHARGRSTGRTTTEDPPLERAFWPALIPLAGPFVYLGQGDNSSTAKGLLIANGVLQVGGMSMLIAGLVLRSRAVAPRAAWIVTPSIGHDGAGACLRGRF